MNTRALNQPEPEEVQQIGTVVCELLEIMRRLRAPDGCPWDKEQTHESIRLHAIEEVYEMIDAIESGDDMELEEELGDLLLQVIFHSRLAEERGKFSFKSVVESIRDKLIRRHPHVFENVEMKDVDSVWKQWEAIKREEKAGSHLERKSALDGVPKGLNGLQRAQKLLKKATKAGLCSANQERSEEIKEKEIADGLLHWIHQAQDNGINAESALRDRLNELEKLWRNKESELQNTD